MDKDMVFVGCLLLCGFIFGILCAAAFYVHTPAFAEQAKADCINKGFYNVEENAQLAADYNACSKRLAWRSFNFDKNRLAFNSIIESVFYTEKLYRDYNTFTYDLNLCKRFC